MVNRAKNPKKLPECILLVSYDIQNKSWNIIGTDDYISTDKVFELLDQDKVGTPHSESSRYVALVDENGKQCELTIGCDRQEAGIKTYDKSFVGLQQLHGKHHFFGKRIRLTEEDRKEKYIDLLSLSEKIGISDDGRLPSLNYDPFETKSFGVYYSGYKNGPQLTIEEVKEALAKDLIELGGDVRVKFKIIYVFENEVFQGKLFYENHLVHEQIFNDLPAGEEFFEFLKLAEFNQDHISILNAEEYAEHIKNLEGSTPKKKDSSSVSPGDKGSDQKQEEEADLKLIKEQLISDLQDGKIVSLPISFLEETEIYQVRQQENKEYESILAAVLLDKAPPIEVFVDGSKIIIVDGYTRRRAAKEANYAPLAAFLSSAKTREEADARAFQVNTGRGNLSIVEEVTFIEKYKEKYNVKNDIDLAQKLGKPRNIISRRRKFATATPKIVELYSTGLITLRQAENIGSITPDLQQKAYENDWYDKKGQMTRNHPKGKITIVSLSYSEKTFATTRGAIPHHEYALELSNKKTIEVFSRTNVDFAKIMKKGEIIDETEDYLEIECKSMPSGSLKMPKRIDLYWPTAGELAPKDEEIKPPSPVIDDLKKVDLTSPILSGIEILETIGAETHYKVTLSNGKVYDLYGDWKDDICAIYRSFIELQEYGEYTPKLVFDKITDDMIFFKENNSEEEQWGYSILSCSQRVKRDFTGLKICSVNQQWGGSTSGPDRDYIDYRRYDLWFEGDPMQLLLTVYYHSQKKYSSTAMKGMKVISVSEDGWLSLKKEKGRNEYKFQLNSSNLSLSDLEEKTVIPEESEIEIDNTSWVSELKAKIDLLPFPFSHNLKKFREELVSIPKKMSDRELYEKIKELKIEDSDLYARVKSNSLYGLETILIHASDPEEKKLGIILQILYNDLSDLQGQIAKVLEIKYRVQLSGRDAQ